MRYPSLIREVMNCFSRFARVCGLHFSVSDLISAREGLDLICLIVVILGRWRQQMQQRINTLTRGTENVAFWIVFSPLN